MSPHVRPLLGCLITLAAAVTAFATEDRITFDLSAIGSPVDHKASGMLGGFDRAAPENALVQPLKLQSVRLSQSTQLPEDSSFALYDRAVSLGASKVILIASDAVKCTDPTFSDPANWKNYWVSQITALATQAANENKNFVWDIYNEPDKKIAVTATAPSPCGPPASNPTMTMTDYNDWYSIWDQAYQAIRSVLPNAKITGPSYSGYDVAQLEAFIDHCAAANTMPDFINWHFGTIANYKANADTIRAYAATYGYTVNVIVGEAISAGTDRNLDPGLAVTLFANAERAGINTLHAAWTATPVAGIPQAFVPHLTGLITPDTLLPRGVWWSYKSYGDMSGTAITADLSASTNLDGLASFDSAAHCAIALVGTMDKSSYNGGTGKVKFTNLLPATGLIDGNGYTHVKVERIPLSEAEQTALPVISEGDCKPSTAGSLEVPFSVTSGREAVKVTVTLPTVASPSRPATRIEGESLTASVISGRTVSALSDSGSSAGAFSKATLGAVGDWVQYTFNAPATAAYWLNLGYKSDVSRGIVQVSVDGTNLGNVIDQSINNVGYPDASVGGCSLAAGAHTLRLTITGKSATATGYTAALDYFRLTPLSPIEGESLTATASAGDSVGRLNDSIASGGAVMLCNLNAVGDYVDFSVPVPAPGLYALSNAVKTFTSRGIFQVSVDGVATGAPVDGYSASPAIKVSQQGYVTFTTAGTHTIRLTIVGRNPASSGYTIGLDYFALVPANLDILYQADQLSISASSGATVTAPTNFNTRGGVYSKVTLANVGDAASYVFNAPDTGTYFLAVRYVGGPDGGQFQMDVDGNPMFGPIDTWAYSVGCTEVGIGSCQLNAGAHLLTFTALGKSCGTAYAIGLDVLRASRVESVTLREAEALPVTVSNGSVTTVSNATASAGMYVEAVLNVGDNVAYHCDPLPAGVYRLETGFLAATNQGRFTALVDGDTVGRVRTAVYSASPLLRNGDDPNTDFGSFLLATAESPVFSFVCESASPGTEIGIDYLSLTKYVRDR